MRNCLKALLVAAIVFMAVIPGAYGVTISVSGGNAGSTETIQYNFNTNIATSLSATVSVDEEGAELHESPIEIDGFFRNFEHNHQVTDGNQNHAEVHAKVINGNDLYYDDEVVPNDQTDLVLRNINFASLNNAFEALLWPCLY